jgi:hypothetical protein
LDQDGGVRWWPRESQLVHWFDEGDQVCPTRDTDPLQLRHGLGERQIGDVDGYDADRVDDQAFGQVTEIRRFEIDDARVLPKMPPELPKAGVHRVDAARTGIDQGLGESARRGPDVERDAVADVDCEDAQRGLELQRSPQPTRFRDDNRSARAHQ